MKQKKVEKKKDEWTKIGVVGVDSGQLMICDPGYIDGHWTEEEFTGGGKAKNPLSYNGICQPLLKKSATQVNFPMGHAGLAVAFSSGLGDGLYDVFAKYEELDGWGRRIVEVKIVLLTDEHLDICNQVLMGAPRK